MTNEPSDQNKKAIKNLNWIMNNNKGSANYDIPDDGLSIRTTTTANYPG